MGQVVLNARELVEQLWAEARAKRDVAEMIPDLRQSEALQHGHLLRHVNAKWELDTSPRVEGRGFRRRVKGRMARTVASVLSGYFEGERDFLAHVVRLQNEVALRSDQSAEDIRQAVQSLRRTTTMLTDRDDRLHALVEARLDALEKAVDELRRSATTAHS